MSSSGAQARQVDTRLGGGSSQRGGFLETDSWDLPLAVVIGLLIPQLACGLIAARPGTVD